MIDPLLSLSLSIEANPGVYALLLGSGVSKSAGIPTGWEVVLDLIHRLARADKQEQECESDPVLWLKTRHQIDADYSKLLDAVGKTPAERRHLLNSYFEPTEDERQLNLKTPTKAHKAIADLVAGGYVKVIITTNFDRLTELAIQGAGVVPVVISTSDGCSGMLPLTHQKCVILKVHGDYQDVRIKNTPEELKTYEAPINQLLDRILDEFGLIVCGWSGDWDPALRAAIERCPTRRFTTYWTVRDEALSDTAKRLLEQRSGEAVCISDADIFFPALSEQVESLTDSRAPHPLSVAAAVATEKRLLAEDRYRIRLDGLLHSEAQKAARELQLHHEDWLKNIHRDDCSRRFAHELAITEVLRNLIITGCYWGRTPEQTDLWASCIRITAADPNRGKGGPALLGCFRLYAAMALLYAGGIAALAARREDTLARLFKHATVVEGGRRTTTVPLVKAFDWSYFWSAAQRLEPSRPCPVSEHFHSALLPDIAKTVVEQEMYDDVFDGFEYRRSLFFADYSMSDLDSVRFYAPLCRFTHRFRWPGDGDGLLEHHSDPILAQGESWPFIQEGMFGGSPQRVKRIVELFSEHTSVEGSKMRS